MKQKFESRRETLPGIQTIHIIQEMGFNPRIDKNEVFNTLSKVYSQLTTSADENISLLVTVCGELLRADSVLFGIIEPNAMHYQHYWNAPEDFPFQVPLESTICSEAIKKNSPDVMIVNNATNSPFALKYHAFKKYGIETYLGKAIMIGKQCIGSLCAIYRQNVQIHDTHKQTISLIAANIGLEELRKRSNKELTHSQQQIDHLIKERMLELEKTREQLEHIEKNRIITQLAGGIAHDFNNQLTSIIGFAELLRDRLSHDDRLKHFCENILKAAQNAADLTANLLAYTRKGKCKSVLVNVHEIIYEMCAMLNPSLSQKIQLVTNLTAEYCLINGDKTLLQNAFLNIGLNARDAMPKGGIITIDTKIVNIHESDIIQNTFQLKTGPYIQIRFSDTGIGMNDEVRQHLFEPFFTTKESNKGLGLGLAAVYNTIKNHRGAITVTSVYSQGTTFQLYFPITTSKETNSSIPVLVEPVKPKVAHILLIDNEDMIRSMTQEMLHECGNRIITFKNSDEALTYYSKTPEKIDIVIVDIFSNSKEVTTIIRNFRKINPCIKMIFSSGSKPLLKTKKKILQSDTIEFIQKPYGKIDLVKLIDKMLNIKISDSEKPRET